MSVPELIELVLGALRRDFYAERTREFKRDERALLKAVSTYGYECFQRGWEFDAQFILREIMDLLQEIKVADADIKYLPVYLRGAVRRHIGQRAEELSARARTVAPRVHKIVAGVRGVEAVVAQSDTEILAAVYRGLGRRRRPAAKVARQGEFL